MESFVANLEQETSCSLCSERFLEPKLLKCFHTFCKVCIKRHAELVDEGNIFKCPKCSSETSFPQLNNVEDLKPSVLHERILKVLAVVESEKVCSVSESHSTASWYCFNCNCSLCEDCQSYHLRFTRDHNLVSLSNLKKEDIESMLSREDNCDNHHGCKLDFFCQECDRFICVECLKSDHGDHKTTLNKKHASIVRASLDAQLEQLEIQEQQISSRVKVLEDIAIKTRDKGQIAIKEVKEKAKAIIEKVQEKERELIEQVEQQIEKNYERKKKSQSELDQTKSAKRYATEAIEKSLPASQMIGIRRVISDNCTTDPLPLQDDDSELVFVESQEYTRLMNVGIGTLVHKASTLDVSNSEYLEDKTLENTKEKPFSIDEKEEYKNQIPDFAVNKVHYPIGERYKQAKDCEVKKEKCFIEDDWEESYLETKDCNVKKEKCFIKDDWKESYLETKDCKVKKEKCFIEDDWEESYLETKDCNVKKEKCFIKDDWKESYLETKDCNVKKEKCFIEDPVDVRGECYQEKRKLTKKEKKALIKIHRSKLRTNKEKE